MSCRKSWCGFQTAAALAGLAVVVVAVTAGCEQQKSPFVKVRGTVVLDGRPLQSGVIQFQPASGQVATGQIGAGGEFTLTTHAPGDGVLPGTYRVTVAAYDPAASEPGPDHLLVPLRYTRFGSSGLQVTIFPDSTSPVNIALSSTDSAGAATPTPDAASVETNPAPAANAGDSDSDRQASPSASR